MYIRMYIRGQGGPLESPLLLFKLSDNQIVHCCRSLILTKPDTTVVHVDKNGSGKMYLYTCMQSDIYASDH